MAGLAQSANLPTMNPYQAAQAGAVDAFVAKFSAAGALVYSTFLGGSMGVGQEAFAIAVDSAGDAYVTGYTGASDFPVVNPLQAFGGNSEDDAFLSEFSPDGSTLIFSTTVGGSDADLGFGIAVDSFGSMYLTGITFSTDFPVTTGAAQTTPGGASDAFVTKVAPIALGPAALEFGDEPVGSTSAAQNVTLSNGGLTALSITSITIVGANPTDFNQANTCGSSLAAGSSCTISVEFSPASAEGFAATFNVVDAASSLPQTVTLTGTGTGGGGAPQAVLAPTSLMFGNQTVGVPSASQMITLSNPGTESLTITSITIGGTNPGDFAQTATTCGASLAVSGSCTISIDFTPVSAAGFSATLNVADNASGSPQSATLSGTGVAAAPQAVLTPTSLAFGNQNVATSSAAQMVTLSNPGTASLMITSITIGGTNPSDFAQTATTCGASLAVSASCTISVNFTPASAAGFSATLNVVDDASGSPQSATLSGTGVTPAAADFAVSSSTPAQAVSAGGAAQFAINVTVTAGNPFNNAVALSASGLPAGATGMFNPSSVTPGANGASSTFTVQTAGGMLALMPPGVAGPPAGPGERRAAQWLTTTASLAMLCLGLFAQRKRSPLTRWVLSPWRSLGCASRVSAGATEDLHCPATVPRCTPSPSRVPAARCSTPPP